MPKRSPLIRIKPVGRLGNQMFQYMLAESVRRFRPDAVIAGHDLRPSWAIHRPCNPQHRRGILLRLGSHHVPMKEVRRLVAEIDDIQVDIEGLGIRMYYYKDMLETFRRIFRDTLGSDKLCQPSKDDLLIHIRLGDNLSGKHPNYFPLPITFYKYLIETTGLNPYFMGQIGNCPYSQRLREAFPTAYFAPAQSIKADFALVRRAVNIVPSISTFGWLASWLSTTAKTIHLPLAGMLNPIARPQIDLLPNDQRYRFYNLNLNTWEDVSLVEIMCNDFAFEEVSYQGMLGAAPHLGTDGVSRAFESDSTANTI